MKRKKINEELVSKIRLAALSDGVRSDSEIARRCGWHPANYHDKIARGADFRVSDLEKIAAAINCSIIIEFKKNEK